MPTKKERERWYKVQMYALSEESRVCQLPSEEVTRRSNEIWHDCFGDVKKDESNDA